MGSCACKGMVLQLLAVCVVPYHHDGELLQ